MRTSRVKSTLLPMCVLATLLVGCTSDEESDRPDRSSSSSTPTTQERSSDAATGQSDGADATTDSTVSTDTGPIDAQRAARIALAEAPGSVVVEVDEHRSGGVRQWEVVVLNGDGSGTEFRIDMETGEVISRAPEGLDQEARTPPLITAQRAMEIAIEAVPGEIIELDLDLEGRRTAWNVEVRAQSGPNQELWIDATTGSIIRQGPR